MGLLNKHVLPANKDEASEWAGTDDDVPGFRWRLKIKSWFIFSKDPAAKQGIDLTLMFFPLTWLFPFTVWFTGFSWWYLFPVIVLPVARRWRPLPTTVFAMKGKGPWRIESADTNHSAAIEFPDQPILWFPRIETSAASIMVPFMLSRCQYWTRWHFKLDWPLIASFHFYPNAEDVPTPDESHPNRDGKLWNFYRGWHIDELGYWGDGGFAGRNYK